MLKVYVMPNGYRYWFEEGKQPKDAKLEEAKQAEKKTSTKKASK